MKHETKIEDPIKNISDLPHKRDSEIDSHHPKRSTNEIKHKVIELFAEVLGSQSNTFDNKTSNESFNLSEPDYSSLTIPNQTSNNLNKLQKPSSYLFTSSSTTTKLHNRTNNSTMKTHTNGLEPSITSNTNSRNFTDNKIFKDPYLSHPERLKTNTIYNFKKGESSKSFRTKNPPTHPLIKSKSDVWDLDSKNQKLNRNTPRLPKRNLKPLDFSLHKKDKKSSNFNANKSIDVYSKKSLEGFPTPNNGSDTPTVSKITESPLINSTPKSCGHIPSSSPTLSNKFTTERPNPFANLIKDAYNRSISTNIAQNTEFHKARTDQENLIQKLNKNLEHSKNRFPIFGGPPALGPLKRKNHEVEDAIKRAVHNISQKNFVLSTPTFRSWQNPDLLNTNYNLNNQNPITLGSGHTDTNLFLGTKESQSKNNSAVSFGCKYCSKAFKSLSKKQSHEQRCQSRLDAMLYSQPEINEISERNDIRLSPTSQHIASLLESVPDLTDSENETPDLINNNNTSHSKRKLNDIDCRKVKRPNNSNQPISKKPISKRSNLGDSSRLTTSIGDSEDTMSLSEGSELARFHGQGPPVDRIYMHSENDIQLDLNNNHTLFPESFAKSSNVNRLGPNGKNVHNMNVFLGYSDGHPTDFVNTSLPINNQNNLFDFQSGNIGTFNFDNVEIGNEAGNEFSGNFNFDDDFFNLASEPPIPWNTDFLSQESFGLNLSNQNQLFNNSVSDHLNITETQSLNKTKNPQNILNSNKIADSVSLNNPATSKSNSTRLSKSGDYNTSANLTLGNKKHNKHHLNTFSQSNQLKKTESQGVLINDKNPTSLSKSRTLHNLNKENTPVISPESSDLKKFSKAKSQNIEVNGVRSGINKNKTSNSGSAGKRSENAEEVILNKLYANKKQDTYDHHGSSSTITLPQDNDDYQHQFMDENDNSSSDNNNDEIINSIVDPNMVLPNSSLISTPSGINNFIKNSNSNTLSKNNNTEIGMNGLGMDMGLGMNLDVDMGMMLGLNMGLDMSMGMDMNMNLGMGLDMRFGDSKEMAVSKEIENYFGMKAETATVGNAQGNGFNQQPKINQNTFSEGKGIQTKTSSPNAGEADSNRTLKNSNDNGKTPIRHDIQRADEPPILSINKSGYGENPLSSRKIRPDVNHKAMQENTLTHEEKQKLYRLNHLKQLQKFQLLQNQRQLAMVTQRNIGNPNKSISDVGYNTKRNHIIKSSNGGSNLNSGSATEDDESLMLMFGAGNVEEFMLNQGGGIVGVSGNLDWQAGNENFERELDGMFDFDQTE
ncbi:hypothetical protein BB559_000925 [Furculomyces boomerangus]|uniref:Uncharacterized protein n=1 Tax=Furculomyces boomerangus TaxID=61424 RepID=A0A2T9Z3L7_9FUNG|nr:hypothetical protein BB559_000925 [Furculomyces boomerangus]